MIYLQVEIPEPVGYIIPISDLHFGDKAFKDISKKKLQGYIKWVKENKNARVVLMGDLFNVSTRDSKTSPFEQTDNEFDKVVALFEPIKSQIVGAIDGNHENRLIDFANFSIMNTFCQRLSVPYMGISGIIEFRVGKKPPVKSGPDKGKPCWQQYYYGYFHHSTGGGSLAGGGLNRAEKLRNIVEGVDFYCVGHNHGIFAKPQEVFYPQTHSKEVGKRRYWLIGCGSYLQYEGSYAERGMLTPQKLGSPRIRLSGLKRHHDVHCSL